jgi:methylmalonyl-CoA mutase cobalamin-binding domain/chain
VGEQFEQGEMFLPDLVLAGEAMKAATTFLEPEIEKTGATRESPGRVVLGTVKGDIHEIGKTPVGTMLSASGFEVLDLGVDVPFERLAEKAKEWNADIVGVSALLTTTMTGQRGVVEELERCGLRPRVKVTVGGAANPYRQTGIGLNPDRQRGGGGKALTDRKEVANGKAAVCANGAEAFHRKRSDGLFRRNPHDGTVAIFAGIENERDNDGQTRFQGGYGSDSGLGEIRHGFNQNGIRRLRSQGMGLCGKCIAQLSGCDLFHKKHFAARADRGEDHGRVTSRLPGNPDSGEVNLRDTIGETVLGEGKGICTKSVGQDHATSGLDVAFRHLANNLRPGEIPFIRASAGCGGVFVEFGAPGPIRQRNRAAPAVCEVNRVAPLASDPEIAGVDAQLPMERKIPGAWLAPPRTNRV